MIEVDGAQAPWRRIELMLDTPTQAGEEVIWLWSNLPATVGARQIAELYRKRWRIEGMFQQLESVLHSEISSLGHPRGALLGFATAVLAHNVLALLQRCVEQAHQQAAHPLPQVSLYHLALQVRGSYEGMLIALPQNTGHPHAAPAQATWPASCSAWPATSTRARSPPAGEAPKPQSPNPTSMEQPHAPMSPPHACSSKLGQKDPERGEP